ncbi:ester cyclase [Rhizosaccharibacter radicis]|uniref:Ester cyclase n=1 Tax=Rhizosaccharibacter radicis TaxID=2782605 RepID=A0ABT1VSQ6_9PROT|nr:ester cyclase [Acetobacteraceae bacterium KSS12]
MMAASVMAVMTFAAASSMARAARIDDREALRCARPVERIVDHSLSADRIRALLAPVDAFYGFWCNGSEVLLHQAVDARFTDHTLPPGRPQGPEGPAAASRQFLAAVPDLRLTVRQQLVVGDRVASHLRFTGHFTGTLGSRHGRGQVVDFVATDIVRVRDGRITDNWHIEDMAAFMRELGDE